MLRCDDFFEFKMMVIRNVLFLPEVVCLPHFVRSNILYISAKFHAYGIYIDSDLTMQTHVKRTVLRCLPRGVSCVKSVTWCEQPHSRCWWSLWSTPDWTTQIACWSACRLTCYVSSSRSCDCVIVIVTLS